MAVIEDAEADKARLGTKPIAGLEALCAGRGRIDGLCWQNNVEQFRQEPLACLEELGVDARDIDLAGIEARAGVVAEPDQAIENPAPIAGVPERDERTLDEPVSKHGKPIERWSNEFVEPRGLVGLADQYEGIGPCGQASGDRYFVSAEQTIVDFLPDDLVARPEP